MSSGELVVFWNIVCGLALAGIGCLLTSIAHVLEAGGLLGCRIVAALFLLGILGGALRRRRQWIREEQLERAMRDD